VAGWNALDTPCRLVRDNRGFLEAWQAGIGLIILLVVVAAVVGLLDRAQGPNSTSPFVAALTSTVHLVPIFAAIVTVLAYAIRYETLGPGRPTWNVWLNNMAILVGILGATGAWLLLAIAGRRATSVDRANPHAYLELRREFDVLRGEYEDACVTPFLGAARTTTLPAGCSAARRHMLAISEHMATSGTAWVKGDGYVGVWDGIHRAEEALMAAQDRTRVLSRAWHDEMRLRGSSIEQRDNLLAKLTRAVEVLGGAGYLTPAPPSQTAVPTGQATRTPEADVVAQAMVDAQRELKGLQQSATPDPTAVQLLTDKIAQYTALLAQLLPDAAARAQAITRAMVLEAAAPQARAVLSAVRHEVNVYRDGLRDRLVHSRNQVLRTVALAGVAAYLLLGVAVVYGVPYEAIVAASAFFLVGALFGGLVNRLSSQADNEASNVEDFRFSEARLLLTPILSGLAAVGGVAATALGADVIASGLAEDGTGGAIASISLGQAFDLATPERFAIGVVVAAIFGLSPERLMTRLNNQAEQSKIDLKNSSAPNGVS